MLTCSCSLLMLGDWATCHLGRFQQYRWVSDCLLWCHGLTDGRSIHRLLHKHTHCRLCSGLHGWWWWACRRRAAVGPICSGCGCGGGCGPSRQARLASDPRTTPYPSLADYAGSILSFERRYVRGRTREGGRAPHNLYYSYDLGLYVLPAVLTNLLPYS